MDYGDELESNGFDNQESFYNNEIDRDSMHDSDLDGGHDFYR